MSTDYLDWSRWEIGSGQLSSVLIGCESSEPFSFDGNRYIVIILIYYLDHHTPSAPLCFVPPDTESKPSKGYSTLQKEINVRYKSSTRQLETHHERIMPASSFVPQVSQVATLPIPNTGRESASMKHSNRFNVDHTFFSSLPRRSYAILTSAFVAWA